MEATGILAAILLGRGFLDFSPGGLDGLRGCRLLLDFVQFGSGNEDGRFHELVPRRFVPRDNEYFGIEVGISLARNLPQLKRVFIPVVRDDVNVRRAIRDASLRLKRPQTTSVVSTVPL